MNKANSQYIKATNYNFSEAIGTDPELMQRSTFMRNNAYATGFNAGLCIPIYIEEILPNDTVEMNVNMALRMQTLATVPYDNLDLDLYWFYAPNRILWDGWKQFCGESKSAWLDKTPLRVPVLKSSGFANPDDGIGTVWDYFGLPLIKETTDKSKRIAINRLPFNMYAKVWNDWFRDTNYQEEALIDYGNTDVTYDATDPAKGGKPLSANKYHDYFTTCLPSPQRAETVSLLDGIRNSVLPVRAVGTELEGDDELGILWGLYNKNNEQNFLPDAWKWYDMTYQADNSGLLHQYYNKATGTNTAPTDKATMTPANLGVDIRGADYNSNKSFVDAFNLVGLRKSIAKQHIAEVSARCGNRYENFLLGFFGVSAPDIETGRTELLGINHMTLNINEVVQTSATQEGSTPQGNISGRSLTNMDNPHAFTKSFVEHGWLMCIAVARYNHSYSQGIEKKWTRYKLEDYYMPEYANMGDVPVYLSEIYATNGNAQNPDNKTGSDGLNPQEEIWGYQEYGAEYKYAPNKVTGSLRPDIEGGLSPWTWCDNYDSVPTNGADWIKEDANNINRSLSIQPTAKVPQLFGNFYFSNKHTRMMPVHSVPGLERI